MPGNADVPRAHLHLGTERAERESGRAPRVARELGRPHRAVRTTSARVVPRGLADHARVDPDDQRPGELRAHCRSLRAAGVRPMPGDGLDADRAPVPVRAPRPRGPSPSRTRIAPDEARARQEALRQPLAPRVALVAELADDVRRAMTSAALAGRRQRIGVEEREHEAVELLRDVRRRGPIGGGGGRPARVRQILDAPGRIRVAPREHPVRERAERVEVRTLIERRARERFGRDDRRRADHDVGIPNEASAPKSSSLHRPSARHADVGGAQVAMKQPPRVEERSDVATSRR